MLIPNAYVSVYDPSGNLVPGFDERSVQLVQDPVGADAGMVEIVAGGSSAMAPYIKMKVIDAPDRIVLPEVPETTGLYVDEAWGPFKPSEGSTVDPALNYRGYKFGYNRDGIVYIEQQFGQSEWPLVHPGPWHILQAQRPPGLIAQVHVQVARVDFLTIEATWYQHISLDMPGAFKTTAWHPQLNQIMATDDGSFGIGTGLVVGNQTYLGYLPGVKVQVGVNEYAEEVRSEEFGIVDYEHPVIVYERPLKFTKWDILALPDGRRLLVADLVHRFQRFGVTLAILQMTEFHPDVNSLIYQVNPT